MTVPIVDRIRMEHDEELRSGYHPSSFQYLSDTHPELTGRYSIIWENRKDTKLKFIVR